MHVAILIYEATARRLARQDDPAEQAVSKAAYDAYTQALVDAGLMRGGQALDLPSRAVTLIGSQPDGKHRVQDGPYADTKEQLGGFYLLEVADMEEALRWAARCPATEHGQVEVRPIVAP